MISYKHKFFKGITLVEMLIAGALLSIISVIVTSFLLSTQRNYSLQTAQNLMKSFSIKAIYDMGRKINSSRAFITRTPTTITALAQQYKYNYFTSKIDLPTITKIGQYNFIPINSTSRILPELNQNMSFSPTVTSDPDPTKNFKQSAVGNSLLFASLEDNAFYHYTDSSGKQFTKSIDLYQIHYYYLAKSSDSIFKGTTTNNGDKLFLMHWESQYYADYNQVKSIANIGNSPGINITDFYTYLSNGSNVSLSNRAKGSNASQIPIAGAWDPEYKTQCQTSQDKNYIYKFTSTGIDSSLDCASSTTKTLKMFKNSFYSLKSGYSDGKVYSIVRNNLSGSEPLSRKVPIYANKDLTDDGYPHGFEVMINGQTGARKVFIRILSQVSNPQEQSMTYETTITFQGKDS